MQKRPAPNNLENTIFLAYLLGTVGVLIFGATLPATAIALSDFGPWFITFARAFIASCVAIIWLIWTKSRLTHPNNLQLFLAGLFLVFGFPGFMALALQTIPASNGGVILGILPLTTAMIARVFASEALSPRFWVLSVLGALIVTIFAWYTGNKGLNSNTTSGFQIGHFWLLIAGICVSAGYVISGKLSRTLSGHEVILRALLLNFPTIALGTFLLWQDHYSQSSTSSLVALAYLGFGSMCFGFFAWNKALAMGGIAKIGQIQLLQIFFTIAASAILLSEEIDTPTILTAIIITFLIFLTRKG